MITAIYLLGRCVRQKKICARLVRETPFIHSAVKPGSQVLNLVRWLISPRSTRLTWPATGTFPLTAHAPRKMSIVHELRYQISSHIVFTTCRSHNLFTKISWFGCGAVFHAFSVCYCSCLQYMLFILLPPGGATGAVYRTSRHGCAYRPWCRQQLARELRHDRAAWLRTRLHYDGRGAAVLRVRTAAHIQLCRVLQPRGHVSY